MLRITEVVKHLLIINVLMFIASELLDFSDILALYFPASEYFKPYQVVTHFFMHGGLTHLFFNMFALWMFGSALEVRWGPKRFLFYYLVCAFGAAVLHMLVTWYDLSQIQDAMALFKADPTYDNFWAFFNDTSLLKSANNKEILQSIGDGVLNGDRNAIAQAYQAMKDYYFGNENLMGQLNIPVVGASGAIYGLLLAFGMKFPNTELMLIFLPIPVKAKYFIPILMVVEFFLGMNQFSWDPIAHFAHLGGALTGFLLILYWRRFGAGDV